MRDRTLYEVEVKAEGTLPTWYKLKRAVPCEHGNYARHIKPKHTYMASLGAKSAWCDGKPEADDEAAPPCGHLSGDPRCCLSEASNE